MTVDVFVVSDFTGETAEHVARAAYSQFGADAARLSRFRYISTEEKAEDVLQVAQEKNALIICTMVDHKLRKYFVERAAERKVEVVDILGPILKALELRLERPPLETPGLLRRMDEEYFRRVKAIEFSIRCDDGRSPDLLPEADLVIIGVSRTSKTPLSMYLAHKGVMVANIPLVPEATPPEELFRVSPEKVIGLMVKPEHLVQIRRERLRVLGLDADVSTYAQWERVEEELGFARNIMRKIGCRCFDVTNRAIEETAQEILDQIRA
ncbi:MAG: kinase/pyrophosphorylase [Synergistaceae bacterium]|nr:kinase/pyrophosphorylase [Synergistaceae bacterium]